MNATVAFYKGEGLLGDKLIRWWTKSEYSHVEIVLGRQWYSSSMRDGGVRKRPGTPVKSDNWDYLQVNIDIDQAMDVYIARTGQKYDWMGIFLTQFLPLNRHSKKRVFSSELIAEMLGWEDPHQYDPGEVFRKLQAH